MIHGDGDPLLFEYIDDEFRFCYVVMKLDIGKCPKFKNKLGVGKYFDFETPYGYGGPLTEGKASSISQKHFCDEMMEYCRDNNIVSQFVRFHPLLNNYEILPLFFETRYLRDTIYIDTQSLDLINSNMDSKNRNMVRKAIKNGVSIEQVTIEDYKVFMSMYEKTMLRNRAGEYYNFHNDYFESQVLLRNNACIFYAMREGVPIAGSMIYYNNQFAHYHLSGSYVEYRKYAPSNLLLYEVACWASKKGIKKFHLGGGMTLDDNLFGFKKQFNKNGRLPFVVGRTVFNPGIYDILMKVRKQIDPQFDLYNGRLIQYRA